MDYNDYVKRLREIIMEGCRLHHVATARGYCRVNNYSVLPYEGKFGKGYVFHLPSKLNYNCSNRYHRIEYFIQK